MSLKVFIKNSEKIIKVEYGTKINRYNDIGKITLTLSINCENQRFPIIMKAALY